MNTLVINTKDNTEFNFVTNWLRQHHIKSKVLSENVPNATTLKAMKEAETGNGVTRLKSASELFGKLGI